MKTAAIALLALLASGLSSFADIQSGKWLSITIQRQKVFAAANFNVSGAGRIQGKALFYNGATARISGTVQEDLSFEFTQSAPGYKETFTGKANKRGDFFSAKLKGGAEIIGMFLKSSATYAGVYKASDTAGDLVWAVVSPDKMITLFVFDGSQFVSLRGKLKAGNRFSLDGSGVIVEGAIRKGKLEGAYAVAGRSLVFTGSKL